VRLVVVGPVLLSAALLAGCGGGDPAATTSDDGACAAPSTFVAEPTIAPGQTVQVVGEDLWSGCRDSGSVAGDGTASYEGWEDVDDPTPLTAQPVTWTQGDTVVELAIVDIDPTGAVELDVTVPADARPGAAELAIGDSLPAEVTVVTDAGASPRTSP
jgi:hypothetical protein